MKYLVLTTMMFFSAMSFAEGKKMISRGGLGFLFPDHNQFVNPGQFALDKGASFEGSYLQTSVSGITASSATPSFVYSSGKFGIGAYGNRAGTSLSTTGQFTDTVGGGLGFAFAKERLTFGLGGYRTISTGATSDGTVRATLTLNGSKRMGFTMGAGATTTLNRAVKDLRSVSGGIGYGFKSGTSFEVNFAMPDLDTTSDYTLSAFLNLSGKMVYFSGGAIYSASAKTYDATGRLGFVFGAFDLGATVLYPTATGSSPTYGGTARLTF